MVIVKRCATLEEAHLARNLLAEAGIDADVLDEATANTAPYLLNSSGIRLAVADEEADQACETLGVSRSAVAPPPKRGGLPVWIATIVGIAAISVLIAGVKQNRAGAAEPKSEFDRNGDGKPDARRVYDATGQWTELLEDNDFNGKWDASFQMRNGIVEGGQRDLDFDGSFDVVSTYREGMVTEEIVTPGGTGNPLFRDEFEHGVRVARWADPERDGKWNERIEFDAMGRETARRAMK